MKSLLALLASAVFSVSALAELPPGHPSADAAADMLHPAKDIPDSQLPQKGKVLSFINTDQYTYIEVSQDKTKESLWLASTTVAVKKGNQIRFDDGFVMNNFYSKTLKRTFPKVLFVSKVVVVK
ncbi:MAG TPA: hypothetical protein VGK14_11795 [Novimethylophilus sp.]|jgi:hypothetical protein|uniref:hypothetical protein n=1 Tax=Novimethylophilus sp. TaxID=2137426 RepID=UPI002F4137E9